ncbi:hypothetical protein ACTMU2_14280 [Cupriavidus basilensis]
MGNETISMMHTLKQVLLLLRPKAHVIYAGADTSRIRDLYRRDTSVDKLLAGRSIRVPGNQASADAKIPPAFNQSGW